MQQQWEKQKTVQALWHWSLSLQRKVRLCEARGQASVFETVHLIHRPDCNWQSAHCVSLFSFSSLKCYVSIWYGGKLSPDPLIQLKKNSVCFPYPVLADLNPHFLVCVVSCCSSTCYCPVEQRMFLSAGGVSHPELVFVMLSAVCSSFCRYSTLG